MDLDDGARVSGGTIDMGAYETGGAGTPLTCDFGASPTEGLLSIDAVFTAVVVGSNTNERIGDVPRN